MGRLKIIPSKISATPLQVPTKVSPGSWRRPSGGATERGYTYQWEQYRKRFLMVNPLCLYCKREGRITEATVVDHIVPHQGNQDLFWRPTNHQPLCKLCHDSTKAKEERTMGYR